MLSMMAYIGDIFKPLRLVNICELVFGTISAILRYKRIYTNAPCYADTSISCDPAAQEGSFMVAHDYPG
jgi:hypothetical protein